MFKRQKNATWIRFMRRPWKCLLAFNDVVQLPIPGMLWRQTRFHADGCPSCLAGALRSGWCRGRWPASAGARTPVTSHSPTERKSVRARHFRKWCSATYLKQCVCFCAGERAQSPLSPRSRLRAYEGQTEDPSNVSVSFV